MNAAATAASETAEALDSAAVIARAGALQTAQDREVDWQAAAMRRLDTERRALPKALDAVEAKAVAFADAWGEVALASSADARDARPKLSRLAPSPDLADLRTWADTPPLADMLDAQAQGAAAVLTARRRLRNCASSPHPG